MCFAGSRAFLVIFGGSWWFLMICVVLDGSCFFLLFLDSSWLILVVFGRS